jgi:PAS domain-containing protein
LILVSLFTCKAQAAAQSNAAPATAAAAKPNPSVAAKTDAPAAKAPSNHPKKRLKSLAAADSSQVKQPVQAASSAAKGQDDSDDKKIAKRAANRLSAHLSRKRKKMYIDDVTTENIDLRRKVQILQSIPDLVVAFDSSGCISFVSRSVPAFLETQASELEGASFWDYLTEDSVNVIKSAFMDALAEKRNPDDDSTLLCHGESLLIKLVDKEGNEPSLVSFKGVVHFTDNAPECISSMRPVAVNSVSSSPQDFNDAQLQEATKNVLPANASTHDISDVESRKAATSNDSSGSSSE